MDLGAWESGKIPNLFTGKGMNVNMIIIMMLSYYEMIKLFSPQRARRCAEKNTKLELLEW